MVPLYQAKAEFFRTLGHPVRIRVLELLGERPHSVRELLGAIQIEASSLSQQLAVLRRAGIVTSQREGNTVFYELAGPDVAELMRAARSFLTGLLATQAELLDALRDEPPGGSDEPPGGGDAASGGGEAAPGGSGEPVGTSDPLAAV